MKKAFLVKSNWETEDGDSDEDKDSSPALHLIKGRHFVKPVTISVQIPSLSEESRSFDWRENIILDKEIWDYSDHSKIQIIKLYKYIQFHNTFILMTISIKVEERSDWWE